MAGADDVRKLAALARLSISDESLEKFSKEFGSILSYIGQIESLKVDRGAKRPGAVRNVLREDGEPRESGMYTERLTKQFPERDGNSLKVKQIISND